MSEKDRKRNRPVSNPPINPAGAPMSQHKYGPHETDAQWYFRTSGKLRGK